MVKYLKDFARAHLKTFHEAGPAAAPPQVRPRSATISQTLRADLGDPAPRHPLLQWSFGMNAIVVGMVGIGVCSTVLATMWLRPRPITPLPVYATLPEFSLIDHRGARVDRAALTGTVSIADFIFTRCAGQCPLMSAQMAKLRNTFRDERRIQFVSFSVDPAYDTPERLAAYARTYDAQGGLWRFVTDAPHPLAGDDAMTSVATLAREGFRLPVDSTGTPEEPVTHSLRLVLIDRAARIRGFYDATDTTAMTRLQVDARRLACEP